MWKLLGATCVVIGVGVLLVGVVSASRRGEYVGAGDALLLIVAPGFLAYLGVRMWRGPNRD